ncbi:HK97 family phage prohead protease [Eubacteriaceae bacterium ES3]|nr:HK97 family phage prohead protease [Eubacteriaceae bacterium ES3]
MKEKRIAEIRATDPAGEEQGLIIKGMPVVFEQETEIKDPAGSYKEIIRRGALDGCDMTDTRLLYNHDIKRIPLARTPKTLQFNITPAGLEMIAALPDTAEARSVHTAVKNDLLTGMSFAFTVPVGGDKYDRKTNTREILKISKIYECSVVPYPAYPQTSVEARAVIDAPKDEATKKAIKLAANKILFTKEKK